MCKFAFLSINLHRLPKNAALRDLQSTALKLNNHYNYKLTITESSTCQCTSV